VFLQLPNPSIGKQHMDVGMPTGIVSKRLDSHYRAQNSLIQTSRVTKEMKQALVRTMAELA
jgi:hypothetical protein